MSPWPSARSGQISHMYPASVKSRPGTRIHRASSHHVHHIPKGSMVRPRLILTAQCLLHEQRPCRELTLLFRRSQTKSTPLGIGRRRWMPIMRIPPFQTKHSSRALLSAALLNVVVTGLSAIPLSSREMSYPDQDHPPSLLQRNLLVLCQFLFQLAVKT